MKFFGAVMSALVFAVGCAADREVTMVPDPGFDTPVLNTVVGPVDVLSIADRAGFREILIHRADPAGVHDVRALEVRNRADVPPGQLEVDYRLSDKGGETCRWVQRHEENPPRVKTEIRSGGDTVRWEIQDLGGRLEVSAEAIIDGVSRQAHREVEPSDFNDGDYLKSLKRDFQDLCPAGPLRDGMELQLLAGVIQSEDWAAYLTPTTDDEASERMRKVCVAAAATSKIACFAAKFLPWAWVACVPATGISLACLVYQINREFVNPEPGRCPCDCLCAPGGEDSR